MKTRIDFYDSKDNLLLSQSTMEALDDEDLREHIGITFKAFPEIQKVEIFVNDIHIGTKPERR